MIRAINLTRRTILLLHILLLSLLIASFTPQAVSAQHKMPLPPVQVIDLIEDLQKDGLVMLIRHERTELPSRPDDYTKPPEECRAQRNLSVAGVVGSKETGLALRAVGIKAGRVISSPMCRSAETARYMFGVDYETDTRLMHHDPAEGAARNLDAAEAEVRELLTNLAPGMEGTNIALISHGGNIVRVSGLRLSEGEIGVLRLGEDGSITPLGQFMGSDLAPYARQMLAEAEKAQEKAERAGY